MASISTSFSSTAERINQIQQKIAQLNGEWIDIRDNASRQAETFGDVLNEQLSHLDNAPNALLSEETNDITPTINNGGAPLPRLPGVQAAAKSPGKRHPLLAMIHQHASSQGVDPNLVKAVVKAESGFNTHAVSRTGAKGLMQLMPGTAKNLGVQAVFNPSDNVKGGTKYLRQLLNKYHSVPMALAAYNAGPGAVDKYGGIPPYRETQNYVRRVMAYQRQFQAQEGT